MPKILQRRKPRPSGPSGSGSGPVLVQSEGADLPPYEPLLQPLNEAGKRKLRELATSRDTRRLGSSIEKSIKYLQGGVGSINDRAAERRADAQRQMAEARKKEIELEQSEKDSIERRAARAEEAALEYTKQTEATLRQLIDLRAELEDEDKVFASVQQQLAAQPQPQAKERQQRTKRETTRRMVDSDGEEMDVDEEEEEGQHGDEEAVEGRAPTVPLGQMFGAARKEQADEYAKLTTHQRYGLNNDYIQFKRTWHDAQHQNDEIPLPDATRWFDQSGEPIIQLFDEATAEQAEDEDDDLVVEREVRSFKCPLSLQWIQEPYSNRKCPHTFDKANILGYLKGSHGTANCPVAGCNRVGAVVFLSPWLSVLIIPQELRVSDFFYDEVFLRKSNRARQAELAEDDSDAEENSDISMGVRGEVTRNMRTGKPIPSRRLQAKAEDEDDD